jgi:arabinose-5-phosphate isomerase
VGVDVSKQQQTSDWGSEELTDAQKEYAASDVLYLHQLKAELEARLQREGRMELAQRCFDFLPVAGRTGPSGLGRCAMTSSTTDLLATGQRVIRREAEALDMLAEALGTAFAAAVGLLMQAKGRVIVSGMGKSGHIARKIAATFASTGTPAHFVHPAEASHGDLGMVAEGRCADRAVQFGRDAGAGRHRGPCQALRHSADRSGGPRGVDAVAAIGRGASVADGARGLRDGDRADHLDHDDAGLGDALAIALMEHRQFTPDHFRMFHPGGKLGARLLRVRDLMQRRTRRWCPMTHGDGRGAAGDVGRSGFGVVGVTDGEGYLVRGSSPMATFGGIWTGCLSCQGG